ncbi:hypothetical protein [Arenimonas donghaensis]|uniref:DUF4398 domain-containing protein n=1 Tax=Arenimonas donghaensis DSM 18148 = HO3-R19 TaxID=1121014 RepID=A0A087MJM4_9GAMM|nr:hypothetical protein [Arenimonas donghaensis]KFL37077.1 hypothetical protein N788_11160 [Arenimonas donghaensis DSM 18148 = HO3-R19]
MPQKIQSALLVLLLVSLFATTSAAADEVDAALAAAERAVLAAQSAQPRGEAAQVLEQARRQWLAAGDARRKSDKLRLAEAAAANADLAHAKARLDAARESVESRAARNADLRRRLLVNEED